MKEISSLPEDIFAKDIATQLNGLIDKIAAPIQELRDAAKKHGLCLNIQTNDKGLVDVGFTRKF